MYVRTYVCNTIGNSKFDQEILQAMKDAKEKGLSIKVRHSKVLFCGSSGIGKTNFINLLLKELFTERHEPTRVAKSKQFIAKEITIVKSQHDDVKCELEHLTFEKQIEWLRWFLKQKNYYSAKRMDADTKGVSVDLSVQPGTSDQPNLPDQIGPLDLSNDEAVDLTETDNQQQKKLDIEDVIAKSDSYTPPGNPPEVWNMLTFLDTGGQPAFINMLPAVTTSTMITFILHSMEGGVDNLINKNVAVYGEGFEKSSNYKYIDFIKLLFAMRKLEEEEKFEELLVDQGFKGDKKCYISLVGTKSDLCKDSDTVARDIGNKLKPIIEQTICESSLIPIDGEYFVPVSNLQAGTDAEDKNAAKFRKRIYEHLEKRDTYFIPIVWLMLELEIKNTKGKEIFFFKEVHKICKDADLIMKEADIRKALQFFHHIGVFLYYGSEDEEMKEIADIVITNHQWIFKNLHSMFKAAKSNKPVTKAFGSDGLLNNKVIEVIDWELGKNVPKKYFLRLLEKLGLIAPTKRTDEYFMSCVLPHISTISSSIQDLLKDYGSSSEAEPLLMQFGFRVSDEKSCYCDDHSFLFPAGMFCCLVNQLMKLDGSKFNILWSGSDSKRCIFNNLVIFDKNGECYVVLVDKHSYLEIQIRCMPNVKLNKSIYSEIKLMIKSRLEAVRTNLNLHISYICYAFQCLTCSESHLIRNKPDNEDFYYKNGKHVLDEKQKVWFPGT